MPEVAVFAFAHENSLINSVRGTAGLSTRQRLKNKSFRSRIGRDGYCDD